jgi:pimeloyl-ACP methyl ester carboxylesterase
LIQPRKYKGSSMIVFLHGVPETGALWTEMRRNIGRESVALSLPGFGCPRPLGFGATMDDYVGWISKKLDDIDGAIDLVGHDWGALLTYRLATLHGRRLRSWAADVANAAHPDYEWHDLAKVWQTPGKGEAYWAEYTARDAKDWAPETFAPFGVPRGDAIAMAANVDTTMAGCIVDLYRSAIPNPRHCWGPLTATEAPGLVLHPSDDPFSEERMAAEVAVKLGARYERMDGIGHWWPYQAPERVVAVLQSFWASLE